MTTSTASTATAFVEALRDSHSVLAGPERRCLRWIAARLPRWVTSDHLTALALAAMALAGAAYWAAGFDERWLLGVVVCLGINWFGDSLDGTVARVRGHQRPRYGFYVDHVVDCVGALFLVCGLAVSGYMTPVIALAVLVAYLLLSIEIYLATYCLSVFRLSFLAVGPTELRLLLAAGTLALADHPMVAVFGNPYRLFDVGGVIAVAVIGLMMIASTAQHTVDLYRAEPLPGRSAVGSR
jgi:archaetidylinositol phosphate synthase